MSTMSFLPNLKSFLRTNGVIYTVRRYSMDERDVEVEGLGTCHREPLGTIQEPLELLQYYKESGFQSPREWWKKIEHFIPDKRTPKYLYRVTTKERESGENSL